MTTSASPASRTTERPAAAAATQRPLSLPLEASRDVVDQVIRGLSLTLVEGTQELRMTLKPESLGEVFLQVRMEEGKMQAQIDVSQPAVKAALDGQVADLRLALQQRGIDVQRIDIIAGSPSVGDGGGNQTGRFKQRMNRHALDPDDHDADPAARFLGYNTLELIM
jgi:flagellar hook-length control protein FliK